MFSNLFNSVSPGNIALIHTLYFTALFPEMKKDDIDLLTSTRIYYWHENPAACTTMLRCSNVRTHSSAVYLNKNKLHEHLPIVKAFKSYMYVFLCILKVTEIVNHNPEMSKCLFLSCNPVISPLLTVVTSTPSNSAIPPERLIPWFYTKKAMKSR